MRKALGALCMLLGVAMLLCAGKMLYANRQEEANAGESAVATLTELREAIAAEEPGSAQNPTPEAAAPDATPVPEMPTIEIDGNECIGYLELPTIGITLPVISEWSYPSLRIAPCRYWGSAYDDTLVIVAHNYDRHFGKIKDMESGDPVQFVDAQGNIFQYVVAAQETLEPNAVEKMVDTEYDLTLFTCTYGGAKRVTVRLKRVRAF